MFNKDFYPTPEAITDLMVGALPIQGTVILEPSAGSGAMIDALRKFMPKEIIACEIHRDLSKIAASKADRFLAHDFLQVQADQVSHIQYIFMNPPFSADEKHMLHAWEIAPGGCTIVSLCNWNTIDNPYTRDRTRLRELANNYGNFKNLGRVFEDAERETDVRIGMVTLHKPKTGNDEFEGYFDTDEEPENSDQGVITYSYTKDIVGRYIQAVKNYDTVMALNKEMEALIKPINPMNSISFQIGIQDVDTRKYLTVSRDTFRKHLLKGAWKAIFNKLDLSKYVTSSVTRDINKFVEQQCTVPFTVRNIQKMLQIIVGTADSRMRRVVVETFDKITSHTHENRFQKEGWKTNSEYIVNRKFIVPGYNTIEMGWSGELQASHKSHGDSIFDDLTKAMCYILGQDYSEYDDWWTAFTIRASWDATTVETYKKLPRWYKSLISLEKHLTMTPDEIGKHLTMMRPKWGEWFVFNHFRVKCFKKGTLHVEFVNEADWIKFNRIAAEAKGFQLASKFTGDFRSKGKGVEVYEK